MSMALCRRRGAISPGGTSAAIGIAPRCGEELKKVAKANVQGRNRPQNLSRQASSEKGKTATGISGSSRSLPPEFKVESAERLDAVREQLRFD
jgi:hypothetical protein